MHPTDAISHPARTIQGLWLHFQHDSLFRNSVYLIGSTAVMAGLGFFFWLINARMFSTQDIGLATTLISVMNLIAILSLVGFDTVFVRFLPSSDRRNDKMNTGMLIVGITALVLSSSFLIAVGRLSPGLAFVNADHLSSAAFVAFSVMSALNILTDSVFLADRKAKYTFFINSGFSALKMVLPFAFVGWGPMGVFSAAATAQSVGFAISLAVMVRKSGYRPRPVIHRGVIARVWRYGAGNYVSGVLNLLPVTVLPIIITNFVGPEAAAYYYIVMMIGNLLYAIPTATTKSLFAEGSNDEGHFSDSILQSLRVTVWLLVPAILVLLVAGGPVLGIFGRSYSSGGSAFLSIIAVSGLPVAAYSVFVSIFQVRKRVRSLMAMNAVYAVVIIGASYALLPMGLTGIGIAWFTGNALAAIVGAGLTKTIGTQLRLPRTLLRRLPVTPA